MTDRLAENIDRISVPVDERTAAYTEFPLSAVEQSLADRFEQSARQYPDRPAIQAADRSLTYAELNRAANQVAHAIIARLGEGEEPIAILLEHNSAPIVAILGILKAGKIYMVLDPANPVARLKLILADSDARLMISNNNLQSQAKELATESCEVLMIETIDSRSDESNPALSLSPDRLAAIFFTSGSTGRPKGVMHNQRSILHFVRLATNAYRYGPADRQPVLVSLGFAWSLPIVFGTLLTGGLLLAYDSKQLTPARLGEWFNAEKITVLQMIPSFFRQIAEALIKERHQLDHLRWLIVAGEPLTAVDLEIFSKACPVAILGNVMASTEASIVTLKILNRSESFGSNGILVGSPLPEKEVRLYSEAGQLAKPGEIGEIAISSRYLAVGYWKRPELTQSVFVTDPIESHVRIYFTGDLGRFHPDGQLELMGRKDFQVKIRGNTVQPAEVEMALLDLGNIQQAVVVARAKWEDVDQPPADNDEKRLVAYVVSQQQLSSADLRSQLRAKLPEYMLPSAFVFMDALPLNANGKVDRHALPAPDRLVAQRIGEDSAPKSEVERSLVKIWERLLRLDSIGIRSDFFDLGGDSLLAARMFAEIAARFQKNLPLSILLGSPTIESLAKVIGRDVAESSHWSPLVPLQLGGEQPPLFLVHGGGGGPFTYTKLAEALGADQPVYTFQSRGLDGRSSPHKHIEDMATEYLELMRSVLPHGPYRIGGYSLGGLIAFEMACRLHLLGETVELLIDFDMPAPAGYTRFIRFLALSVRLMLRRDEDWQDRFNARWIESIQYYSSISLRKRMQHLARKLLPRKNDRQAIRAADPAELTTGATGVDIHDRIYRLNGQAGNAYRPRSQPARILLFKTTLGRKYEPYVRDPEMRWSKLAGGVDTIMIDGTHDELLRSDRQVAQIAQHLKAHLAALPPRR